MKRRIISHGKEKEREKERIEKKREKNNNSNKTFRRICDCRGGKTELTD